jgi:two-component system response regulator FlrC
MSITTPEPAPAAPSIMVVAGEPMVRRSLARAIERIGAEVTTVATEREALARLRRERNPLIFADVRPSDGDDLALLRSVKAISPDTSVVLITRLDTPELATRALQEGASDVLATPFTFAEVSRIVTERLNQPAVGRWQRIPVLTESPRMEAILALARRVASSDATVLVQGETGTGKELLARFIHDTSARASRPFVAVNCCALPETLVEAELFGHERGAFTGAVGRRAGRFEVAAGGTLVLDEVTEIPLPVQAKLLRALQEREVHRVGSSYPIKVDVRVIAISNRDLRQEVQAGRFRQDLFYRLNVVNLTLPPLRERPADVALLSRHFLQKYAEANRSAAEGFAPAAMARLLAHSWPGNVRELENVVHGAVVLSTGPEIGPEHVIIPEELPALSAGTVPGRTVVEVEKDLILSTLKRLGGNRTHTAKALGVSVRTIRNRLREYKLTSGVTC